MLRTINNRTLAFNNHLNLLSNNNHHVSAVPKSSWNNGNQMMFKHQQSQPLQSSSTASSSSSFNIEHDQKRQKFRIDLDPEYEAFLNYERLGSNEVLLYHTEVPEKFRNLGLAKSLANEAFKHFKDTKQKMIITCTYLQKFDKNNAHSKHERN